MRPRDLNVIAPKPCTVAMLSSLAEAQAQLRSDGIALDIKDSEGQQIGPNVLFWGVLTYSSSGGKYESTTLDISSSALHASDTSRSSNVVPVGSVYRGDLCSIA